MIEPHKIMIAFIVLFAAGSYSYALSINHTSAVFSEAKFKKELAWYKERHKSDQKWKRK